MDPQANQTDRLCVRVILNGLGLRLYAICWRALSCMASIRYLRANQLACGD